VFPAENSKLVPVQIQTTTKLVWQAGTLQNGPKTTRLTMQTKSRPTSHSLSCAKARKSTRTQIPTQTPLIKASITKNQTYPQ